MKIEAGKWYRTREGHVVQAEKDVGSTSPYIFYFGHPKLARTSVTEGGRYYSEEIIHHCDLIEEVPAPDERGAENRPFQYGDKVTYAGEHSYFRGYFLGYIYKLPWTDPEGNEHPAGMSCNVQQEGTGTVFVKPAPTEKNRGWR